MELPVTSLASMVESRFREVPNIRGAFIAADPTDDHRRQLWVLVSGQYEEETDRRLIEVEAETEQQLGLDVSLEFRNIYLGERDPAAFIPQGAHQLRIKAA